MVRVSAWCAATLVSLAGGSLALGQVGLPGEGEVPLQETVEISGARYSVDFVEQRENGDTVYALKKGNVQGIQEDGTYQFVITPRITVELAEGANATVVANAYGLAVDNPRSYVGRRFVTLVANTGAEAVAALSQLRSDARLIDADLLPRGMRMPSSATPRGEGPGTPVLPGDPAANDQWHLFNDASFPGSLFREDINVIPAWEAGFFGAGHTVLVVDDGIQLDHPDLAPRFNPAGSFDSWFESPNAGHKEFGESHGTACAGLIVAEANDVSTVGVAFEAELTAYRVFFGSSTDEDFEAAHTFMQEINDVTSNSYGVPRSIFGEVFLVQLTVSEEAAFLDGITNGRNGLGTIYMKSGGNDRGFSFDSDTEFIADDASYDGFANSRYTISVTASDAAGVFSSYAEPGGVHLVNAPSNSFPFEIVEDEDGLDLPILFPKPGIFTNDVESLVTGPGDVPDSFTTPSFGGTSAACPIAAGVVMLMLEANPNLTWRDVQWILAETATPNNTLEFLGLLPDGSQFFRINSSWQDIRPSIFNANVGLRYSNDYGFGRVNAGNAVALSQVWNNLPPEIEETYGTNIRNPIPLPTEDFFGNTFPVEFTFSVQNSEIQEVQHIEILLDLDHGRQGELLIELISPDGIVHTVNPRSGDLGQGYRYDFTAVKYLGTAIDGIWTLRVTDVQDNNFVGFINDAALNFYGIAGRTILQDCNGDQIEDAYQIALDPNIGDCDGDSVIDSCQIAADPMIDFDQNGELDSCQILRDPEMFDCNGDGILDAMTIGDSVYFDCNANGRLDVCDLVGDPNRDRNANGYFDFCEPDAIEDTNGPTGSADFTTFNLGNNFGNHCGVSAPGQDFAIPVVVSEARRLTATVNSAAGSGVILALRDGDTNSSNCLALGTGIASSRTLESPVLPAGTYFLVVDSDSLSGDFTLDVVFDEPIPVSCAGDFDTDGDIDLGDFGAFAAAFNTMLGDANYLAAADFDSDGDVDLGDFGFFASVFNTFCEVEGD